MESLSPAQGEHALTKCRTYLAWISEVAAGVFQAIDGVDRESQHHVGWATIRNEEQNPLEGNRDHAASVASRNRREQRRN